MSVLSRSFGEDILLLLYTIKSRGECLRTLVDRGRRGKERGWFSQSQINGKSLLYRPHPGRRILFPSAKLWNVMLAKFESKETRQNSNKTLWNCYAKSLLFSYSSDYNIYIYIYKTYTK